MLGAWGLEGFKPKYLHDIMASGLGVKDNGNITGLRNSTPWPCNYPYMLEASLQTAAKTPPPKQKKNTWDPTNAHASYVWHISWAV